MGVYGRVTSTISLVVSSNKLAEANKHAQVVKSIGLVVSGRPNRSMKDVPPLPQGIRFNNGTDVNCGVN